MKRVGSIMVKVMLATLLFVAMWPVSKADADVQVNYSLCGRGSDFTTDSYTVKPDRALIETEDGYVFAGWYKEDLGINPWRFGTDVPDSDTEPIYIYGKVVEDRIAKVDFSVSSEGKINIINEEYGFDYYYQIGTPKQI